MIKFNSKNHVAIVYSFLLTADATCTHKVAIAMQHTKNEMRRIEMNIGRTVSSKHDLRLCVLLKLSKISMRLLNEILRLISMHKRIDLSWSIAMSQTHAAPKTFDFFSFKFRPTARNVVSSLHLRTTLSGNSQISPNEHAM